MDEARRTAIATLRSQIGQPRRRSVSGPIEAGAIRRWAIAVYWPEQPPRRFWDATVLGGVVAPAEFNPFAWPIDPNDRLLETAPAGPFSRTVNGGTEVTYGVELRPGDVVTSVSTLVEVTEKVGRSGSLLFQVTEDIWTNQRGDLVKRTRQTIIVS
ncbi:MAG: MaoC family dehydratase N-terminal domain-containing protein [Dehalococcoidia bacterium]